MDRFAAIETFVAVIETGSFSAAARRLKVGQPTVSKSVAQLEEWLGVQLLLRSSFGLTPTEGGQGYYAYARRAVDEAEEADLATRGVTAALTGRLRVCGPVTFCRIHIVPRLKAFLESHPQLAIDVVLDDRSVNVLGEGIDVELRLGGQEDSAMTATKISEARRLVVGTPAYFSRAGEPRTPSDLAEHEAIIYAQGLGGATWHFRRDGTELSTVVAGRLHVTAAEGVRAAVLADMGLAIASEWMFAPELSSGAVKPVLTEWTLPPLELWAVFPAGRKASTKARAFVDFIRAALEPAADSETR